MIRPALAALLFALADVLVRLAGRVVGTSEPVETRAGDVPASLADTLPVPPEVSRVVIGPAVSMADAEVWCAAAKQITGWRPERKWARC